MEWLDLSRVVIAIAILVIASISDWRTRMASDLNWLFLGCVGLGLIIYQLAYTNQPYGYYLFIIPLGVVFFDIFWDRKGIFEDGLNVVPLIFYIAAFISFAYLFYNFWQEELFWQLLVVLIMFFVFMFLYQLDIIKGGADAKALIALSLVFPTYPIFYGFPIVPVDYSIMTLAFPFSLLILFNAAILSLVVPISLFFLNGAKRDFKFPAMFLGYRMNLRDAKKRFVWPMERIEDGQLKFAYFPKENDDHVVMLEALEKAGVKRVWVTPKIPFLIFITAGLIMSVIVGNLVLVFMN